MSKNKYLVFMAMGVELVSLILTSLYLGRWLDEKFDLKGLAMVGLSMLALAGWIFHIVQLAKRLEKDQ